MDIDGLGKLIEEGNARTELMFNTVKEALSDQKSFCHTTMQCMEKKVAAHDKALIQIRTIGSLLSFAWGVIVLFSKELKDVFWK